MQTDPQIEGKRYKGLGGFGDASHRIHFLPDNLVDCGKLPFALGWKIAEMELMLRLHNGSELRLLPDATYPGHWISANVNPGSLSIRLFPQSKADTELEADINRARRYHLRPKDGAARELVLLADGSIGPGSAAAQRSWVVSGGILFLSGELGISMVLHSVNGADLFEGENVGQIRTGTVELVRNKVRRAYLVHGLQRTCTNLVQYYFDSQILAPRTTRFFGVEYWKHGWLPSAEKLKDTFVIVCVRHPLDWLFACYKYFQREQGADKTICNFFSSSWSFSEFLRSPHYHWTSPAERWNILNQHWLHRCHELGVSAVVVKAESFQSLAMQSYSLQSLANAYDPCLTLETGDFILAGRMTNTCEISNSPMNSNKYWECKFLLEYNADDFTFTRDILDYRLMNQLGYYWPDSM